jgi:hypothetical protein
MIKTKALVVVLLLGLLSCWQTKPANNNIDNKPKIVNKDNSIIGEWMIFATEYLQQDGRSVPGQCNACPTIIFNKDYSGFVKSPDAVISPFTWATENNKLLLKNVKGFRARDVIMKDGVYKIIYPNKKLPHRIDLLDTVRHIKYWLD